MQNLSNNEKVIIATRMLYFLLNASQTTDKKLPLCEATDYIKIFRNKEIIANTHPAKISVVENLKCIHKLNLLGLGINDCTIEKIYGLVVCSFCVSC